MNYMMQMNNFWTKRRISRLNSGAADLYYALLSVSNSIGWNMELSVSNLMLMAMTDLTKSSLLRARQELIDGGYIRYETGAGSKPGVYTLIEFKYEELFR